MATREHLQEALERIWEDMAQLKRAADLKRPTRAYEWMRTGGIAERIYELKKAASQIEARIADLPSGNSD